MPRGGVPQNADHRRGANCVGRFRVRRAPTRTFRASGKGTAFSLPTCSALLSSPIIQHRVDAHGRMNSSPVNVFSTSRASSFK